MCEKIVAMDQPLTGNEQIEEVIHLFHQDPCERLLTAVCMAIRERMMADGHLIFPADILTEEETQIFSFKTVDLSETETAIVAFTSRKEQDKAPPSGAVSNFIESMFQAVMERKDLAGVLLNPWGESIFLDKDALTLILVPGLERHS